MTPPTPVESLAGPRPRNRAWFASEWSLGFLALVLAVLVWAVVRREISVESEPIEVRLVPETSPLFAGYVDRTVPLMLRGPGGEVDDARRALGTPPVLRVRLPDLLPGESRRDVARIPRDAVAFPFPARLVGSLDLPRAEVYRLVEEAVDVLPPRVSGVPPGIGVEIHLEPASVRLRGPAGQMGAVIEPDPIDLAAAFREETAAPLGGSPIAPAEPLRMRLGFDTWREDPVAGRFRSDVTLPGVEAVFRFHVTGRSEQYGRVAFEPPGDYEITTTDAIYENGRFKGTFEGWEADLAQLEDLERKGAWWYVVRIPPDKMPTELEPVTEAALPIEWFHSGSLGLKVRFASQATLVVQIKRIPREP